jgi:hypothetical protein
VLWRGRSAWLRTDRRRYRGGLVQVPSAREPSRASDLPAVRAVPYLPPTYTKTEASLPHKVKTLKDSFLPVDNFVSWTFVAW